MRQFDQIERMRRIPHGMNDVVAPRVPRKKKRFPVLFECENDAVFVRGAVVGMPDGLVGKFFQGDRIISPEGELYIGGLQLLYRGTLGAIRGDYSVLDMDDIASCHGQYFDSLLCQLPVDFIVAFCR